MEEKMHSVVLEERCRLKVTNCDEVTEFNEKEIVLMTSEAALVIRGEKLKVEEISKLSGEASVAGESIDSIVYTQKRKKQKEGIIGRILK